MPWVTQAPGPYLTDVVLAFDGPYIYIIGGIISGTRQTTVTRYDVTTGATDAMDPLPTGLSTPGVRRAAVLGGWAYFGARADSPTTQRFWRYNLSTGVTEERAGYTPGTGTPYLNMAAADGRIYDRMGWQQREYDPSSNTWGTAPGTAPTTSATNSAVASAGASLILAYVDPFGGNDNDRVFRYTPGDTGNEWVELPPQPSPTPVNLYNNVRHVIVHDDHAYILSVFDSGFSGVSAHSLDLSDPMAEWEAWDSSGIDVSSVASAASALGALVFEESWAAALVYMNAGETEAQVQTLGQVPGQDPLRGEAIARATATGRPTMQLAGRGRASASATATGHATVEAGPTSTARLMFGVEYPFPTQQVHATGSVNITGGPGQSARALLLFGVPERDVAHAAVFFSVVPPVAGDIMPIPKAPEGNKSIIQPDIP